LRIIAHLEKSSDGSLLWSNTYERSASDLFAMQTELAVRIAENLKLAGGLSPRSGHVPPEGAHDAWLKGRYELSQNTTDSLLRAESDFRRAISLDPMYANAYYELGTTNYNRASARGGGRTVDERQSAEQLYRKALDLDPTLPGPRAMLAAIAMQYDWDWNRAERELRVALSNGASSDAEVYYAFLLVFQRRFQEAAPHLRRALDMDPFSPSVLLNIGLIMNYEGRFAESRGHFQNLGRISPGMVSIPLMIAFTYIEEGRPDLATPVLAELRPRFAGAQVEQAMALARAGHRAEALTMLRPFEEKYSTGAISMQWFALVYAFLGDQPNTLKWLERSADQREFQALNLAVHPAYAFMQASPGFEALKKRMGLPVP
jgi:tetratricopeptide (TPR) repeat protein